MRELSLFSGAGGGLLGTKLLGWQTVGYVEFDDYCQQIIALRIKDGILDEAPIFTDIRAFNDKRYAYSYTGMVDVITAGFPCQPFSAAGKRLKENDERNMWPATLETIRKIRPKYCLLENVSALLESLRGAAYFGRIQSDLAECGYYAKWAVLGANQVGAKQYRKRVWIIAHAIGKTMEEQKMVRSAKSKREFGRVASYVSRSIRSSWWETYQPCMVGTPHDMANWMGRSKAIGNGQVPAVVAAAWELLK